MSVFGDNLVCAKNRKCILVYVYFVIIVIIVLTYMILSAFLYGLENASKKEPFMKLLTGDIIFIGSISGWRISHFITFFIAGFLFPECICLIFILGVVWEMIEYSMANICIFISKKYNSEKYQKNEKIEGIMYNNNGGWLDGSVEDIIYNTLGLFFGVLLSKYVYKVNFE